MGFAEKDCPRIKIRGVRPYDIYELSWFNPGTGERLEEKIQLEATHFGNIVIPDFPDELDWAFKLKKLNSDFRINNDTRTGFSDSNEGVEFKYMETDSQK